MAYFRVNESSSAGVTPTITVTYDSTFYNKTITCTKGTTTYTKTTTSSGSTEFSVKEAGTWTITCNGVSRTVDVVLEYSLQIAITKTVTVYSAASDTLSFTDATGAKTVTTNTSGRGSVSITFIPPSANITFTSSKAKNPNNLSQAYSKTITMTNSITTVYVMPNKVLYWYGYIGSNCESCLSGTGWSHNYFSYVAPTYNTNNVSLTTSSNTLAGIGTKNTISASKIYVVNKVVSGDNNTIIYNSTKSTSTDESQVTYLTTTSINLKAWSIALSNQYVSVRAAVGSNTTVYAFWYE